MAMEFGLQRNRIASFDSHLSDRLVRFGKVAQARGHHREAKRYFWQAIMVAPHQQTGLDVLRSGSALHLGGQCGTHAGAGGVASVSRTRKAMNQ